MDITYTKRITRITQRIHLGRITRITHRVADSPDYRADSPRRILPDYPDYPQVLVTDYPDSPRTDYLHYADYSDYPTYSPRTDYPDYLHCADYPEPNSNGLPGFLTVLDISNIMVT